MYSKFGTRSGIFVFEVKWFYNGTATSPCSFDFACSNNSPCFKPLKASLFNKNKSVSIDKKTEQVTSRRRSQLMLSSQTALI